MGHSHCQGPPLPTLTQVSTYTPNPALKLIPNLKAGEAPGDKVTVPFRTAVCLLQERARKLRSWYEIMMANKEDLAKLISLEVVWGHTYTPSSPHFLSSSLLRPDIKITVGSVRRNKALH